MTDYHEQNRKSWNAATEQHHSHKPDLVQKYVDGYSNLHDTEIALLGDIAGKSLVHLQCNDGQDTISIGKHLGATVTGVDISDTAIAKAQKIASAMSLDATFVREDIFIWCENTDARFDVVYTGYGALNWLADIERWGQCVERVLNYNGRLVLVEFHPLLGMLDYDWQTTYNYMGGKPEASDGVGDYVGNDYEGAFQNPHKAYEFAWGIGEVVSALLSAGLSLTNLTEYPYVNGWQALPDLQGEDVSTTGKTHYYPPENKPAIALMYSIVATKWSPF
ncbi:MAG: class I SAM-dependent methyltransferase [Chloroflexota bacterium]